MVVAQVAQKLLVLWAKGGSGCNHVQSQRFLDANWTGLHGDTDSDPPLRSFVVQLAAGCRPEELEGDTRSFNKWRAAFTTAA